MSSPSRSDQVVRALSAVIGGPGGTRMAPSSGFWRASTVLVLLATAMMMLAALGKHHCRSEGWSTPDQFWHACYSDVPVLYVSQGLGRGGASLAESVGPGGLGQPPVPTVLMWTAAKVTDAFDSAIGGPTSLALAPRQFFDVSAVLLTGVLIVAVLAVAAAAGRRRVWDAAHLAASPVLLTVALLSYELVAVLFTALALLAWSRRRVVPAGLFLGLAVCSRPVLAMIALALLGVCLRAGRIRDWAVLAGSALATWFAVRLILFPGPLDALGQSWQAWKESTPGYGSVLLIPQLLAQSRPASADAWYSGPGITSTVASMITLLGLTAVAVAVVMLALWLPHRPRLAHLALIAVGGSLLVTKSYPVQTALILLPLIALSALPWRDHLIWASAEALHFVGVWLYIAAQSDADRGLPAGFYLLIVLLRVMALGWIVVQAIRMARDPARDPVRVPTDHVEGPSDADDPAGGVVDHAPDAMIIRTDEPAEPAQV